MGGCCGESRDEALDMVRSTAWLDVLNDRLLPRRATHFGNDIMVFFCGWSVMCDV
jgi:uncharacterized protein (DUF2267 family)